MMNKVESDNRNKNNQRSVLILSEHCIPPILIIVTCLKILLFPCYRSTDFDVHRNWLAITHKLPLEEWYFDNVGGTTVHTLDYPPAFAYFEWVLANNPLTAHILPENDRCLDLLPDSNNTPSLACITFHRSTVVLCDLVLWFGAIVACSGMHPTNSHNRTVSFLLIVLNPGLIWLDHIHFQYNGMLLGLLLLSLGLLLHAGNIKQQQQQQEERRSLWYDFYILSGAAVYGLLVNLKHLYLPLGPLYFCYLLETYCFSRNHSSGRHATRSKFLPLQFLCLAIVTAVPLLLPWVPFLLLRNPKQQIVQILSRLFPFARGLVHDYWAANIWALYMCADKVLSMLSSKLSVLPTHLPEVKPLVCAGLLIVSMVPGWEVAASRRSNEKFIQAVVYCSFCSFMLAYHVHEKAILTTIIPLTLLVGVKPTIRNGSSPPSSPSSYTSTSQSTVSSLSAHRYEIHNLLFWDTNIWGLVALFPLMFEPRELTFKVVSYFTYLSLASILLKLPPRWTYSNQIVTGLLIMTVIVVLEILPIQGKWEFLPLLITSLISALGLVGCWCFSLWLLLKKS